MGSECHQCLDHEAATDKEENMFQTATTNHQRPIRRMSRATNIIKYPLMSLLSINLTNKKTDEHQRWKLCSHVSNDNCCFNTAAKLWTDVYTVSFISRHINREILIILLWFYIHLNEIQWKQSLQPLQQQQVCEQHS